MVYVDFSLRLPRKSVSTAAIMTEAAAGSKKKSGTAGARTNPAQPPRFYFSDELIDVNLVFSLVPSPLTAAMMASEMPAAISPYSMAVAPLSSRRKRINVCIA
jgi:hypothetical protein